MAFYTDVSWGYPPYLPTDPKEYGEGGGMLTKAVPVISTWDGVFEGQNRTVAVVSVAPGKVRACCAWHSLVDSTLHGRLRRLGA